MTLRSRILYFVTRNVSLIFSVCQRKSLNAKIKIYFKQLNVLGADHWYEIRWIKRIVIQCCVVFLRFKWPVTYCVKCSVYLQRNRAKLFQPMLAVGVCLTYVGWGHKHFIRMNSEHNCFVVLLVLVINTQILLYVFLQITFDFLQIEASINSKAVLLYTTGQRVFQAVSFNPQTQFWVLK